jgi:hypothetical protein
MGRRWKEEQKLLKQQREKDKQQQVGQQGATGKAPLAQGVILECENFSLLLCLTCASSMKASDFDIIPLLDEGYLDSEKTTKSRREHFRPGAVCPL